jgi:hypothetical protein
MDSAFQATPLRVALRASKSDPADLSNTVRKLIPFSQNKIGPEWAHFVLAVA